MTTANDIEQARAALQAHRAALQAHPGVQGVGIGRDGKTGDYHIVVYVLSLEASASLASQLDGIAVRAVVTGQFSPS